MMINKVDYTLAITPPNYKCGKCGATGVKLWRGFNSFHVDLLCAKCASKHPTIDISNLDRDGMRIENGERTDQIGFYVPAVPCESGETYWDYTSVPYEGVMWWQRLPNDGA